MPFKKWSSKNLAYASVTVLSLFITLTQCSKSFEGESFAPSNIQAVVSGVTANNGGALYCSISGGCPLRVTGSYFYEGAKAYIGPYPCLNNVVSSDHNSINCTVGPGKSGVFEVTVMNKDGKTSLADPAVDPTLLQFSYASFLYLGVQDSPGKVYAYAQNPVTGALLSITGSPFSIAGNNSTYGTVLSPDNKFLYAANVSSGTISIYSINALTGALSQSGTPVASGGGSPNGLYFHPSSNFLYVSPTRAATASAPLPWLPTAA